ncbi:MAG TPA: efflux RND transporter permease subunit, partial [Polyangiaceae bacterium]
MIARLIAWCARNHWLVIGAALLLAVAGDQARRGLSRDVVPDLADPQIGIVADWMGHSASEVAALVTSVLTKALDGAAGAKAVRGTSMSGMAYVDVVFDSTDGLDAARAEIARRVDDVRSKLPRDVRLQVGPAASSTGWVFEYALTDPALVSSPFELRRFQEDVLRPALSSIRGVAEVASVGGDLQQVRIEIKPRELRERGLAFSDIVAALRRVFSQGVARASTQDLQALPVNAEEAGVLPATASRKPVRLDDVALVRLADDMPTGWADLAGVSAVGGIVVARRDANLAMLVEEVKQTLVRECHLLPHRAADPERLDSGVAAEVHLVTTYDRAELASRVRHTLLRALGEEVCVVVLVVLMFLLHVRSAIVPLATLPVVLLLTFTAMWLLGVPATIMSLGGIGIA